MDKFGDIELFVKIVRHNGLASAGKELGLSPASITGRLNRLETSYGVRLLNRTTRRIALTEEGRSFYESCVRILSDVHEAEEKLMTGRDQLSGSLKISTTFDLGKQQIAPLLGHFAKQNPNIRAHLNLDDDMVNLVEDEFDLAIRYGALQDSRMVARKLTDNYRVLCAAPAYLKENGPPSSPSDLKNHRCLAMVREKQTITHWHFNKQGQDLSVDIMPSLTSNNGAQIREWALSGLGIALKSYWDIKSDLDAGRLELVLKEYRKSSTAAQDNPNLYIVYPTRKFLPARTKAFIDLLIDHFASLQKSIQP